MSDFWNRGYPEPLQLDTNLLARALWREWSPGIGIIGLFIVFEWHRCNGRCQRTNHSLQG